MRRGYLILAALLLSLCTAGQVQASITINFDSYATGTALTSLDGITFSLVGGPDSSGPPLIGFDSAEPRGLSNSTNPDYPTANILDFAFSSPVSSVSFGFNNYGDNGATFYQAFDSTGTLLETGPLYTYSSGEITTLSASCISDLQFNNGTGGASSWYFAVTSIEYTPWPPPPSPPPSSCSPSVLLATSAIPPCDGGNGRQLDAAHRSSEAKKGHSSGWPFSVCCGYTW